MNGYDLGRAAASQIFGLILIAFAAGGIIALLAYLAVGWLVNNVSITFG